jgi:RHS repeat-associated protein
VDGNDATYAIDITGGYQTLGRGVLSSTSIASRHGYASYENDGAISRFHHVPYRVLDSSLGRWTRRDPLGYVDGMNLYQYVGSRITKTRDAFGLLASQCNRAAGCSSSPIDFSPNSSPKPTSKWRECIERTYTYNKCLACCPREGFEATLCQIECMIRDAMLPRPSWQDCVETALSLEMCKSCCGPTISLDPTHNPIPCLEKCQEYFPPSTDFPLDPIFIPELDITPHPMSPDDPDGCYLIRTILMRDRVCNLFACFSGEEGEPLQIELRCVLLIP